VPPANSVALQNIELSSLLLPRPEGPPDAPNPVVYLSRHWLHLLRTCSTPGDTSLPLPYIPILVIHSPHVCGAN
jgi:hypothetical protein